MPCARWATCWRPADGGPAGDTFDQRSPEEWQRRAWRLALALLLTAGSATAGAMDGHVADAIQSAGGMIGALTALDALWPRRPKSDDDKDARAGDDPT
jgi:hypothetical protein